MDELNPQKLKAAVKYINSWLEVNFENSRLPAMQVAIQHGSKIIYSEAFGYSDVKAKEKLNTRNVFRIASHSKTFTATAIMLLVEAGKLNLDDKVNKYVSWFKSSKDKRVQEVTIRQLLNHTAGIVRDGYDSNFWQLLHEFPDKNELKAFISDSKLVYDPDEKFKYSNFGFGYLGQVIEAVSEVSYREYVTKNIVDKLGLKSTGPDLDSKAKKLLATGYGIEIFNKERRVFDHIDTHALSSATGFYSNAEDCCRYFASHFIGNNSLISDKSKRLMQHGYWKSEGTKERYGLGMVNYKLNSWNIFGHSGGFPGFTTNTKFDAKKQLVVSVLINAYGTYTSNICSKLISIIDTFQQDTANIKTDVTNLKKFEGRFFCTWGPTDVILAGKKLLAIDPLNWADFEDCEELTVLDEDTLKIAKSSGYGHSGELIKYKFDSKGKITSFTYAGRTMLPFNEAQKQGWFS
ncbi:MAG TPA: serine hydrolase domain-containing protein [Candidatus Saccharimonadales bacterium]|nr:serine hydrolase domain-containing protein [Candidatus Saccharimonadales bacterium]